MTTIHPPLRIWKLKNQPALELINQLSVTLQTDPVFTSLLIQRGYDTEEKAIEFLKPDLKHLFDPLLMKGMLLATSRITDAVSKKEKIMILGDYDVDGTTSVALLMIFLKKINAEVIYYLPDRYKEGYGVSIQAIDFAIQNKINLIISVDCGINAHEQIKYARNNSIDFIVCDHHQPEEQLPPAIAILDPKQGDCSYPFKELSGCGVAFKLVQAIAKNMHIPENETFILLDLVAISIASDIVPIIGENRILAAEGLKIINSKPRKGIKLLLDQSVKKATYKISDLVFGIGPRINAAGRMNHAKPVVELLCTEDDVIANLIVKDIEQFNTLRKDEDKHITQMAMEMLGCKPDILTTKTTVVYHPEWHKGVIGIVASRLIEKYYKPTIVLTRSNGSAVGSARSVDGFNIYNAIYQCRELLEKFGGHAHAAGLTLKTENIDLFSKKFEEITAQTITDEQTKPVMSVDAVLNFNSITPTLVKCLHQLEPCGPYNPAPLFATKNVMDTGSSRIVGEKHIKLKMKQNGGYSMDGIAFNLAHHFNSILSGKNFHISYTIEENEWNGIVNIQLNVKDLKF